MVIYRRCWKHALLFTTFFSGIYIFHQSAIDTQNGGCMVEEHRAKNCTVPALKSLRQYNSYINNKQADCSKWVYAFDPTIGLETQKISPNIHFFNLGISNYQGLRKIGMNPVPTDFNFTKEYPVDTYENILKMLGLTDVPIDMIKMDVETSEIEFLQDVLYNTPHLLRNVKQMAVEIHHDVYGDGDVGHTSIQHVFWVLFHHLKCHGFKMYMSRDGGFFREVVWAREADW
ncbi:uncharacterized protein [Macrobrachium rosenbergii]|uniref:uncharacterized protein isoform X2 n=1 Tax=Macrobrachium rosenbergii TaxID=79674 RepID=UPI0034D636C3